MAAGIRVTHPPITSLQISRNLNACAGFEPSARLVSDGSSDRHTSRSNQAGKAGSERRYHRQHEHESRPQNAQFPPSFMRG